MFLVGQWQQQSYTIRLLHRTHFVTNFITEEPKVPQTITRTQTVTKKITVSARSHIQTFSLRTVSSSI